MLTSAFALWCVKWWVGSINSYQVQIKTSSSTNDFPFTKLFSVLLTWSISKLKVEIFQYTGFNQTNIPDSKGLITSHLSRIVTKFSFSFHGNWMTREQYSLVDNQLISIISLHKNDKYFQKKYENIYLFIQCLAVEAITCNPRVNMIMGTCLSSRFLEDFPVKQTPKNIETSIIAFPVQTFRTIDLLNSVIRQFDFRDNMLTERHATRPNANKREAC